MKKLIAIADLQVGMFVEAETVSEVKDGETQQFLVASKAMSTGDHNRRARLTGRMHEKVEQDGGLLITSANQVRSLGETGLSLLTIDTDKGKDLAADAEPLSDPSRRPPTSGRLVHFDEEIAHAKQARTETTDTLRSSLEDVAAGRELDFGRVKQAGTAIAESVLRNVDAMVSLTRLKKHDPYTAMHSMNVCTLVTAMAMHGGASPSELPMITTAALLHDVGKTRVPLEVLNKPGRFEPGELMEMRKHATYSGDIMREMGGFGEESIAIATQHHEMMDGSGYPLGLWGDHVHHYARLTAVADVYDALTAKRVYKPAMPMYQSLLRIHKNKGSEFDESAVDLFVKTLGLYPVGSLVELNTRERAVVYEPNPQDSRKPTVGIYSLPNESTRSAPLIVRLALRSEAEGREIAKVLDPERESVDPEQIMHRIERHGEVVERRRRS
jgi:putative nucleotidyltransferase with HDIG domain